MKPIAAIKRTPKTRPECRWVKLARERHEADLKDGHKRGLWFDEEQAEYVRDFFPAFLRHSKGPFKGKPYHLEDWQYRDSVAPLFGWMKLPGKMKAKDAEKIPRRDRRAAGILRRYRNSYEEIARKNGKSTRWAGQALYLDIADNEGTPEIVWGATTKEQSTKLFGEIKRMIAQSPDLKQVLTCYTDSILSPHNFGSITTIAADATKLDGLNLSAAIIDELHAHPTAALFDVLRTSMGARDQPLCAAITTAGVSRTGPCWREREYLTKILQGSHHDDSYFGTIYTIDEGDDWRDEDVWIKANPGLGVFRGYDDMRDFCTKAEGSPATQNTFRRYYLNEWLQADERALEMGKWRTCAGPLDWRELADAMTGKACVAGLDMANRFDLAAYVMAFRPPKDGGPVAVVPHFWMPEETVSERSRIDAIPYDRWVDEGAIHAIPGDVIDQEVMLGNIVEYIRPFYEIEQVQFDPWNAAWMVKELERYRFKCAQCKPCFGNLSEATKQLIALVRTGALQHGGHPVMEWMAENLVLYMDRHGNMMPDRKGSKEKIDGPVALVMALRGLTMSEEEQPSVYTKRGAIWVGK